MFTVLKISGEDIKKFRKKKGLTQVALSKLLGVHKSTIINYEKGDTIPASKREILIAMIEGRMDQLVEEPKITYPEDIEFIELPFVSVPARATFIDLPDGVKGTTHETHTVIKRKDTNYEGQILIEVNGDSMEPYYPSGTIVRCKQIDPNDWPYLRSGVYAVVFANAFVIKRIKDNNFQQGFITLHSDNLDTGGKMDVFTKDLRQVWRVEWIEGAPAR